ncbi:peptidoglycan D,D-transpeptidase FtsI family protein [Pelagibaculum spongiae]|uniref:Peptidoglycan D,D-transpeptidase FtsI n=1 Tax=Pelagibaculum spongiae TaxID=2080658 RepID=A0A2V1H3W9_9GAMM|nr:penicillin-binding transpeptidase domain-containing protein [Pelagibaculum spongiae]PVZ71877.1 cell division protein [Pelagibaculum spongiae]
MTEQLKSIKDWRLWLVAILMIMALGAVLYRMADIQLLNPDFLRNQGDARSLRVVSIPAGRGMITDRYGKPLAISTPVKSVWADPSKIDPENERLDKLCRQLSLGCKKLRKRLTRSQSKEFLWVKRHVNPALAEKVSALKIPGIFLQTEYRRYYPAGEVAAHVVGFTDIDLNGQEGIERSFDRQLQGANGNKRVLKNLQGQVVEEIERIAEPRAGKSLALSIDLRMQYLAYRELKAKVAEVGGSAGSVVVMDIKTGEVLAMASQPSFNPNDRRQLKPQSLRNRAVTDTIEPGSTMKPLTVLAGIESGKFDIDSLINVSPRVMKLDGGVVRDHRDFGKLSLAGILQKSSNIGVSRIALDLPPNQLQGTFAKVGLGMATGIELPGESSGKLSDRYKWKEIDLATMSFGYGLSVTPIQLARAYSALANKGKLLHPTLLKTDKVLGGEQVLDAVASEQVVSMMEGVVSREGTAFKASVAGYRVAGKTGTVRQATAGGYSDDSYMAFFAGVAPATNPRLAMVVVVRDPRGDNYHGGDVAAPVFSRVMAGGLRLMNIAPDQSLPGLLAAREVITNEVTR